MLKTKRVACLFGWVLMLLLAFAMPSLAGPPDDPFADSNKVEANPAPKKAPAEDPFGEASKAQEKDAPKAKTEPAPKVRKDPTAGLIDFDVSVSPKDARRGQTVKLTLAGTLKPGYHTYPITQRSADPAQTLSGLSTLKFQETPGLQPLWPITESSPQVETYPGVGVFLVHERPFTWSQDILVLPDATPGPKPLRFSVKLQVCSTSCVWGERQLETTIIVLDAPAQALTPALEERLKAGPPKVQVVPAPGTSTEAGTAPAGEDRTLLGLLLVSMGGAVAMLFTPCVFPMIPITVSFFLKQSEKKHHNALLTAGVYSLTIILVLAAAVLLLGGLIVKLANDAWLNLGLGLLLVFFALSLFGMYEIELPSGLARFTAAHEGKGGYIGAFFMALTFTITSFTCTGPFLGPLLVAVKEYQLSFGERLLGSLAYSATFAAPFFVLALFPTLLKALPKSGGWLNAVKVVMGFLELAAALKFLANTDLAWNPGDPMFFNYETVLSAWIALAVACGLYLLGVYRLPHDTPLESLGVGRMLLAATFFGLAVYMLPAMGRVTPQGTVGKGLVAFLPLDTKPVRSTSTGAQELDWHRDFEAAWALAAREDKLIFVDFTGQNCTNCRYNETNVFTLPAVRKELEKYVRVQLYTDSVPDPTLTSAEADQQGDRNSDWQNATFGDITNPFYAILRPEKGQPALVADSNGMQKLNGVVPGWTRKGLIPSDRIKDFEEFLSGPQKQLARVRRELEPAASLAAEARLR